MNKPGTVKTRVWQDESRLATVVTWIATTTALIVALAAPLGYFLLSREAEVRDAAMAARLHAAFVTQLVSASPDDWRQDVGGLLDTDLAPSDVPEQRRVEDSAHVVVATAGAVLHGPVVERAALVTGPEGPVGAVVIARSLQPILTQTGLVALLGVALGLSIYGSLRVLPLRALRRTLAALQREEAERASRWRSSARATVMGEAERLSSTWAPARAARALGGIGTHMSSQTSTWIVRSGRSAARKMRSGPKGTSPSSSAPGQCARMSMVPRASSPEANQRFS